MITLVTLKNGETINLSQVIKFIKNETNVQVVTTGMNCGTYISFEEYDKIIERFSTKI